MNWKDIKHYTPQIQNYLVSDGRSISFAHYDGKAFIPDENVSLDYVVFQMEVTHFASIEEIELPFPFNIIEQKKEFDFKQGFTTYNCYALELDEWQITSTIEGVQRAIIKKSHLIDCIKGKRHFNRINFK